MYKKLPFKLYHIHDFLSAPIATARGFFFNFLIKVIPVVLFSISCSSHQKINLQSEGFYSEGFYGNTLRIVVYDFIIPEGEAEINSDNEQIKEKVYSRATLLIASYLSIKIPKEKISPATDKLFNDAIEKTLGSCRIMSLSAEENSYYYIVADFDISPINDALASL